MASFISFPHLLLHLDLRFQPRDFRFLLPTARCYGWSNSASGKGFRGCRSRQRYFFGPSDLLWSLFDNRCSAHAVRSKSLYRHQAEACDKETSTNVVEQRATTEREKYRNRMSLAERSQTPCPKLTKLKERRDVNTGKNHGPGMCIVIAGYYPLVLSVNGRLGRWTLSANRNEIVYERIAITTPTTIDGDHEEKIWRKPKIKWKRREEIWLLLVRYTRQQVTRQNASWAKPGFDHYLRL